MEQNVLNHHGILGMKWGVRRYQNKDGSLTSAGKKRRDKEEESIESKMERRSKALSSTNAKEIYKNRDVLSTAEINERINRIDTEQRLSDIRTKARLDKVDKILKVGKKMNEVYEFTNTPMMKALKKKLGFGGDDDTKETVYETLQEAFDNRDKRSLKDLQDALKRDASIKNMKKRLDEEEAEREAAARKASQKEVDEYNERLKRDAERADSTYRYRNKKADSSKSDDYENDRGQKLLPASKKDNDDAETVDVEFVGYRNSGRDWVNKGSKNDDYIDVDKFTDVPSSESTRRGEDYTQLLLEDKRRYLGSGN